MNNDKAAAGGAPAIKNDIGAPSTSALTVTTKAVIATICMIAIGGAVGGTLAVASAAASETKPTLRPTTNQPSAVPSRVPTLSGQASQVHAGVEFTCVLMDTQAVKCFGLGDLGQLGNGSVLDSLTPVQVVGLDDDTFHLECGTSSCCALNGTGALRCWGHNGDGQLGIGNNDNQLTAQLVIASGVSGMSLYGQHSCAVIQPQGQVQCWGHGNVGQLGIGGITYTNAPDEFVWNLTDVASVGTGDGYTCAMCNNGTVFCFGQNANGRTGLGTEDGFTLVPMVVSTLVAAQLSVGVSHSCVLEKITNKVKCWGFQYGSSPIEIEAFSSGSALSVTAGDRRTCVIFTNATDPERSVSCWGYFDEELSVPTTLPGLAPALVMDPGLATRHACAISQETRRIQCWGSNRRGELGLGYILPNEDLTHRQPIGDFVVGL